MARRRKVTPYAALRARMYRKMADGLRWRDTPDKIAEAEGLEGLAEGLEQELLDALKNNHGRPVQIYEGGQSNKYRAWTPQEDAKLVELVQGGKTYAEAGQALGRTKSACLGRYQRHKSKAS